MTRSCKDKKKVENMKANYKNKIMIIERDFVRNLITSKNTKRKVITVLSESQFKGIKENSKVSNNFYLYSKLNFYTKIFKLIYIKIFF